MEYLEENWDEIEKNYQDLLQDIVCNSQETVVHSGTNSSASPEK